MASSQLPGFGFAEGQTYEGLKAENPLMYRIHPVSPDGERGLVADAFRDSDLALPFAMNKEIYSLQSVTNHLNIYRVGYGNVNSPWLSCTFSPPFVVYEGYRRMRKAPGTFGDFYISIIQTKHPSLVQRTKLATELLSEMGILRGAAGSEWRFANADQEVLVAQNVPIEAILATIPWKHVVQSLQNALLIPDFEDEKGGKIERFRTFCWRLKNTWMKMTCSDAANQAAFWLQGMIPFERTPASLVKLQTLLRELAIATHLWSYRRFVDRDGSFQSVTFPPSWPIRRYITQHQLIQLIMPAEGEDVAKRVAQQTLPENTYQTVDGVILNMSVS